MPQTTAPAHVSNSFQVVVRAPLIRAAADVQAMAKSDAQSGVDWQQAIEKCLAAR
jgi:hypothetical protein